MTNKSKLKYKFIKLLADSEKLTKKELAKVSLILALGREEKRNRNRRQVKVRKFKKGGLTIEQKESNGGISQIAKNRPPRKRGKNEKIT